MPRHADDESARTPGPAQASGGRSSGGSPSGPSGGSSGGSPRVFLHIGEPKTGTTFLQQVMWRNRSELAARGVVDRKSVV